MSEYTNLKPEHLFNIITAEGLRLYEMLKGNAISEFEKNEIEKMLREDENDYIKESVKQWLEKLEEAVAYINENTEMRIEVKVDGEIVIFNMR